MFTIFSSLAARARLRRACSELLHLDDHRLRDMGLTRHDVHRLMAGHDRHAGPRG